MDDLREKLAKLGAIGLDGPVLSMGFRTREDAKAAHDAVMAVKDQAMGIPAVPADSAWQAEDAQAAFIKGAGDNAHLLQGGDAIDPIDAPLVAESDGAILGRIGTDAEAWVEQFMHTACFDNPLGRALRSFPHGDRGSLAGIMAGWFANAIGAGYSAARPLDPGTICITPLMSKDVGDHVGDAAVYLHGANSDHFGERSTDHADELREENAHISAMVDHLAADAAGEGMGVAGECSKA